MNFRQLIETAMHEARDEFAAVVARKLEELMGVEPHAARRPGRPPASATAAPPPPARSSSRRRGGRRAAPEHMAKVQEKVLHAMTPGEPMRKGVIMKAARLGEDDDVRVRNVLAKLKTAGILTMKGLRGSATYTLKG